MRRCEAHEGEEVIGVRIGILVFVIAVGLTGGSSSGAAAPFTPAGFEGASRTAAASESCPYAQLGVAFYRGRFIHHQLQRGASVPTWRKPRNCADARYLSAVWAKRSLEARQKLLRWRKAQAAAREKRTLHDFVVRDGNHAWSRAVDEVQRVFPGTSGWLMSCSASEGGHGRWVRYGGGAYYPGYEETDEVGNWLQFRWSTFKGFLRNAVSYAQAKGFLLPEQVRDHSNVRAWLSPLGTALAGAWGITHGMRHHWAGAGCQ